MWLLTIAWARLQAFVRDGRASTAVEFALVSAALIPTILFGSASHIQLHLGPLPLVDMIRLSRTRDA